MSELIEFHTPSDDKLLAAVGRLALKHSHLDHVLRLTIKRLLNISIDSPEYLEATDYMSRDLRVRAEKAAQRRYGVDHPFTKELHDWLMIAKDATEQRNFIIHGIWIQQEDGAIVVHENRDRSNWQIPAQEWFAAIDLLIEQVLTRINTMTKQLPEV